VGRAVPDIRLPESHLCVPGDSTASTGRLAQVSEVGGTCVGGTGNGQRGVEGRVGETESERKLGRRLLGAVRSGKPRTREH
jgi:hypothetical protein